MGAAPLTRVPGSRDPRKLEAAASKLYDAAEGDPRRLATVAAQFQAAAARGAGGTLEVVGGVSFQTRRPYVELTWGEQAGQIDVEAARAHAMLVLEAAQNAVADAALLEWAVDELEVGADRAAQLIDALRQHRADRWGQPDLELEFARPAPDEAGS